MTAFLLAVILLGRCLAAPVDLPVSVPVAVQSEDGLAQLTGVLNLPKEVEACKQGMKLPITALISGTGLFDRDVDFGVSGTEEDLLFLILSKQLNSFGISTLRMDVRGVKCSAKTRPTLDPPSDFEKACVDAEVRKHVTPETIRSDIAKMIDAGLKYPCIDPERLSVFAHSEGSIHVAHLIADKKIMPKSLVLLGGVAESPKSLVHWQFVDSVVSRVMRAASSPDRITTSEIEAVKNLYVPPASPSGFWTREELLSLREKEYEGFAQQESSKPDGELHEHYWTNRWWKMWWTDEVRPVDLLKDFKGELVIHSGERDEKVPHDRQFPLFQSIEKAKLVSHPGKGHSLGEDPLKGPMAAEALNLLLFDLGRVHGVGIRDEDRFPELAWDEMMKKPYIGVTFSVTPELPKDSRYSTRYGLTLLGVFPTLPAWRAGLRPGDIVLGLNGVDVSSYPIEFALARVIRQIQGLPLGQEAHFKILRRKLSLRAQMDGKELARPDIESLSSMIRSAEVGHEYSLNWKADTDVLDISVLIQAPREMTMTLKKNQSFTPIAELAEIVAQKMGIEKDLSSIKDDIRSVTARADAFRIPMIDAIQKNPFELGEQSKHVSESVLPLRPLKEFKDPVTIMQRFLSTSLSIVAPDFVVPEIPRVSSQASALERIEKILERAAVHQQQALLAFTPDEKATFFQGIDPLLRKIEDWNYIYLDDDLERRSRNITTLELLSKVNLTQFILAERVLLELTDPSLLSSLPKTALVKDTPYGKIRIGGVGPDNYDDLLASRTAVLIDLGGDDRYADYSATARAELPLSVCIDLGGDDEYETKASSTLASAFGGVSLLVDLSGNDRYLGAYGSQALAVGGVALLIDQKGDDFYRAHTYAQGVGFYGVAAIMDAAGDDVYESNLYSQGVGIAGGVGALIDLVGDDHYLAKGYYGSGYGTPGTYQGWSQGVGVGIRFMASGGVGLLIDGQGRDRFDAGDFSQGGGYWYGMGILDSRGSESDRYQGSRYAQGFSAHSALGAFFERGGSDQYRSVSGVSVGNANDRSVSWFEDNAGNDLYEAKSFSIGASANNSIAVFLDHAGINSYLGEVPPGSGQENDYYGGKSFSLNLDLTGRTLDLAQNREVSSTTKFEFDMRGGYTLTLIRAASLSQIKSRMLKSP